MSALDDNNEEIIVMGRGLGFHAKSGSPINEDKIENKLNREFNRKEKLDVVVSDLTYVNVQGKWNYICLIIDLFNREIIGYAAGKNKNAELVYKAFGRIRVE